MIIWYALGSWGITKVIMPWVIDFLIRSGLQKNNYQRNPVPVAAGLAIIFGFSLPYAISAYFLSRDALISFFQILLLSWSIALIGFVDDLLGDKDIKGLRGHLRSFWQGNLTTGGLKAVAIGTLAFGVASAQSVGIIEIIIDSLIIAFFANTLNLLDLRPGRAIKAYLTISTMLFLVAGLSSSLLFMVGPFTASIAYLPYDLKEKAMLGDTGSNVLGAILGLGFVWFFSLQVKAGVVFLLFSFHWLLERVSLTKIIEKNKVLRFLDNIGRLQPN
ncbi:MAG: UDP-N-acetylmuramyl pentapeptide phosphotransferase [Bacillota bacterium]